MRAKNKSTFAYFSNSVFTLKVCHHHSYFRIITTHPKFIKEKRRRRKQFNHETQANVLFHFPERLSVVKTAFSKLLLFQELGKTCQIH